MAERQSRRVQRPGAPGTDPTPQATPASPTPGLGQPQRAAEDTDRAWGDTGDSNDQRLLGDKPPHWG